MTLVHDVLSLYIWVLVLAALMSWFPTSSSNSGLATTRRVLAMLTEPVLRPIRQILPRPHVGGVGIDFSVLVAIILVEIINAFI